MGRHVECMRNRRGAYSVLVVIPEGKRHLEDLGVDGRIILKYIFKKWNEGMDWIDMANDRERWRDLVSAVMNFRVAYYVRNFLSS
jgi:hypothetical protein